MEAPETLVEEAGLLPHESSALIERNYRALYGLGVHGLLLRPFSIIHEVPEPEYLIQIRGESQ
jgi:hypothetical protein